MLNDIKEIKNWLLEYNLDKNAKYDFISKENHVEVNVLGDVKILKTIKKIPLQFGIVEGSFICMDNELESLEGAPYFVRKMFNISDNYLMSLEHAPQFIGGSCRIQDNLLKSLEYCTPIIQGFFDASNNQLETLLYFPDILGNLCYMKENPGLLKYNQLFEKDFINQSSPIFWRNVHLLVKNLNEQILILKNLELHNDFNKKTIKI